MRAPVLLVVNNKEGTASVEILKELFEIIKELPVFCLELVSLEEASERLNKKKGEEMAMVFCTPKILKQLIKELAAPVNILIGGDGLPPVLARALNVEQSVN
ncbi:MAG: hypothetical protein UU71_C0015G0009 [Parcubacteria group bacterium GW2011_GWB1_41_6]|nr:MAG: hypothetical protein UU71_C0015G0009 [Parcubacteria group bacterium GW2011_GWB1_41_6]KKS34673.1 MAG: hypothetical protein UU96_C0001G0028 [Parcubacteria group bacterium GW2011_GWC2_42_13]KKS57998.1 MAG: hypothetical protein UV22_C0008G0014 [Parcubacteria group bacterium GW2011_GWA2_42_35]